MDKYCNCKEPTESNDKSCCLNQDCGLRIKSLAEKYGETLGLLDIAERRVKRADNTNKKQLKKFNKLLDEIKDSAHNPVVVRLINAYRGKK